MMRAKNFFLIPLATATLAAPQMACTKTDMHSDTHSETPMLTQTTGPIDNPPPDAMRGEWLYSGKILNTSTFRESEIPNELRAVGFWANVRKAPLDLSAWRSAVMQERYRLVFTQYEQQIALQTATIRIASDSLSVPIWMTAHHSDPSRIRPLDRVHLGRDSTLEFYLGTGQLMPIKWVDSMLISAHFSEEGLFTYDVWVRK